MQNSESRPRENSEIISREAGLQILAEIATSIGRNHHLIRSDAITGFMAMQGRHYNNKLMVIGRAVNGWTKETWEPKSLGAADSVQGFVDGILMSVTAAESCPMQWVSKAWGNRLTARPSNWNYVGNQDYNTRKSAFWRVIRSVVGELRLANVEDDSWPSHLVWSNLYKISPAAGRNPPAKMCSLQREDCISLLEMEIQIYKPRRILFLTGLNWADPFLKRIAPNICPVPNSYLVHAAGTFSRGTSDACTVVVATHPERKPETEWVQEVIQAFRTPN
ncbi:MAG TPA: hypothetical protein VF681_00065 [Abditibacteriaceae bacterium]|jgi:hypothetical protein